MVSSLWAALFSRRFGIRSGGLLRWRCSVVAASPSCNPLPLLRRFVAGAAEKAPSTQASQPPHPPAAPLLMVSSPQKPHSRYFYDPNEKNIKLNRVLDLPQIAGHHCVGSSQGFLFTLELSATTKIGATNPLTGATLPLPVTPLIDSYPNPDSGDILRDDIMQLFTCKAILSPSLTTSFLLFRNIMETVYGMFPSQLPDPAFASMAAKDDHASWSIFDPTFGNNLVDCIFHKGLLYLLTRQGTLATYNLTVSSTEGLLLPVAPLEAPKPWYLVESPRGDDLYLVSRTMKSDNYRTTTKLFKVFKLETDHETGSHGHYRWNRVRSIGNTALFVGSNTSYSVSLSGGEFPHLKPNCIYFTPDLHEAYVHCSWLMTRETGVFNLEDGSLRLYCLYAGCESFDWPIPPVWYMP